MTATPKQAVDFALVKRLVSLSMVLSRYGLLDGLKRSGAQLVGRCPIHKGRNPRAFVVNTHDSTWRCFGDCDRGGATLELVAELENIDIREAAVRIASWFALNLPHVDQPRRRVKMSSNDKPAFKAFVVEDKDGEDDKGFWNRVGSAWPHKDGKGFNLVIPAGISVSGRIVLREFTDDDVREDDRPKAGARRK